ncbi:hypothetical protein, partial [Erythrobacter sp. CCH5-A1]|uniref:hypothetical protein n=1 Tax=Erythrobacter sp. CCH5-A1 TaxID=1768792 RepID=UPI001F271770
APAGEEAGGGVLAFSLRRRAIPESLALPRFRARPGCDSKDSPQKVNDLNFLLTFFGEKWRG